MAAQTPLRQVPESRQEISLSFSGVVKKSAGAVVNVYGARVEKQPRNPFMDDPFFRRFVQEKGATLQDEAVREEGRAPHVDLTLEKYNGEFVRELIAAGLVNAVHDVSDGGMAVALAEMALSGGIGAEVENHPDYNPARWWFGEDQGRYIVTVPDVAAFQAQLAKGTRNEDTAASGVRRLGTVGGDSVFGVGLDALRAAHQSFFKEWMEA